MTDRKAIWKNPKLNKNDALGVLDCNIAINDTTDHFTFYCTKHDMEMSVMQIDFDKDVYRNGNPKTGPEPCLYLSLRCPKCGNMAHTRKIYPRVSHEEVESYGDMTHDYVYAAARARARIPITDDQLDEHLPERIRRKRNLVKV